MPSWNIHTAHVERLVADCDLRALSISDANVFLFGNYVPDIYLGFMVPDTTYRIDYCLTHAARPDFIPVPDADFFWDRYLYRRRPTSNAGLALALGVWAHLVADRFYNGRFRSYWHARDLPRGEALRKMKQADFDLFGRSFAISSHVSVTDELLQAAQGFRAYSVLPEDVARAVEVANRIVDESAELPEVVEYQVLAADWLHDTFEACHERLVTWLETWIQLEGEGLEAPAAGIRVQAGLPPATPDDPSWKD